MKNMQIGYRPTWAEINLANLQHNFFQLKKRVSADTKILVTVKADAYGHGLIPVAQKLVSSGVDFLGVASIDEGIRLREARIKTPVLILGLILKKDIKALFEYNLTPTACEQDFLKALNTMASLLSRRINVHIKIDTGMGRIGVLYSGAEELIKKAYKLKSICIEGLFTHFPFADTNKEFTLSQLELLNSLVSRLSKSGIRIPLLHTANSMGVLEYKGAHLNMIRPGLIIYGLHPRTDVKAGIKPVLSLKTRVIYVKKVPAGYGISYGHIYVTNRSVNIVTLPIGYGDGYPRNLSNIGPVLIRGKRFNISGRICMDQIMVDVGDTSVRVGDEVVLIGSQKGKKITTEELAELSGTIPYEIVCGLGSRIPRVYIN